MTDVVLYYFSGRGVAFIPRAAMGLAGLQWREEPIDTREAMLALLESGKLPFQQIPLLEIDGFSLVESGAITRYIAERYKLAGDTLELRARIDMLASAALDLYGRASSVVFAADKLAALAMVQAKFLPKHLPAFEKELTKNGPFLTGDKPMYCDAALYCALEQARDVVGANYEVFPHIQRFMSSMEADSNFAKYLAGPHHYPAPDDHYVNVVNKTLGR